MKVKITISGSLVYKAMKAVVSRDSFEVSQETCNAGNYRATGKGCSLSGRSVFCDIDVMDGVGKAMIEIPNSSVGFLATVLEEIVGQEHDGSHGVRWQGEGEPWTYPSWIPMVTVEIDGRPAQWSWRGVGDDGKQSPFWLVAESTAR